MRYGDGIGFAATPLSLAGGTGTVDILLLLPGAGTGLLLVEGARITATLLSVAGGVEDCIVCE